MNLIEDAWIPVRRRNGEKTLIAPWQVTEGEGDREFIGLAAPRPDFNGALIQFLIGLAQTTYAPKNTREWRNRLDDPPKPEELKKAFQPLSEAFDLDGDGPRFMQDLDKKLEKDEMNLISNLFMDSPGDNTIRKNTDFFIKRGRIASVCPTCAATALFTLQTNAPSGGQGHRTGLRGGGPLTTLIVGPSLWNIVWGNVLEKTEFLEKCGNAEKDDVGAHFPWLSKTRTSEKGQVTTPEQVHPDQNFWSMPRRIRLAFKSVEKDIPCDICSTPTLNVCEGYFTKNYGVNYSGAWSHPLTPYVVKEDGAPLPKHMHGRIGYRHWLGFLQAYSGNKTNYIPARSVANFREKKNGFRLWAFGYDMDKMKASGWIEGVMPLALVSEGSTEAFVHYIHSMIQGADETASQLRWAVKAAMFGDGETRGDLAFVEEKFWEETEADFYGLAGQLAELLEKCGDVMGLVMEWRKIIRNAAEEIFDEVSQNGSYEEVNPARVMGAWKKLAYYLYGEKLDSSLGLRVEERLPASRRK